MYGQLTEILHSVTGRARRESEIQSVLHFRPMLVQTFKISILSK